MSNPIAEQAHKALTAPGYPTTNGLCQKFARLIVQATEVGHKYDDDFQKSSAKEAAEAMLAAHPNFVFRFTPGMVIQPGDLLYKTVGSGGFGHVGVYLGSNEVAENSTYQWNKSGGKDARGIRTLNEFGAFQVVVRFPIAVQTQSAADTPANPTFKAFFNDAEIAGAVYDPEKNILYAPVRSTLAAVGIGIAKVGNHVEDANRFYAWGKKVA